ncbi:MAG TPA: TIM barrel protein [Bacillota bacterium]|nr:TIM barrel protein [Bacillota bacterium]
MKVKKLKYSVGTWQYGPLGDRFVPGGYQEAAAFPALLDHIAAIEGVTGVELVYPGEVADDNHAFIVEELQKRKLEAAHLCVDLYAHKKWRFGSITADREETRREAVQTILLAAEAARRIGCRSLNLWFGQDGHDYLFQRHYLSSWKRLVDTLQHLATEIPDLRLCLEYKLKEPRTHSLVPNTHAALLAVEEAGAPNLGVTLDVGHAMAAGENMAEAASLLMAKGRLFHLHLNDNYRYWDDDMAVGSVHTLEFLELLYWLNRCGYEGWFSLDVYPFREDPARVTRYSIDMLNTLQAAAVTLQEAGMEELITQEKALEALELARKTLFKS